MHVSRSRAAWVAACAALGLACVSAPALANLMASNDTSFSYTGTVTDPNGVQHTIPGSSTTYTGRDASVLVTRGAPTADAGAGYENSMIFMTNWYATLLPADGYGTANPNNTSLGYVQLYDSDSSGVSSVTGGWTDNSYTTFTMTVTGFAGSDVAGYDMLWPAPQDTGPWSDTVGAFGAYSLILTATFAPGAVTAESPGWYSTTANPLSVTGSFSGAFTNTGSYAPGAYTFDFNFVDGGNWAGANNAALTDGGSYFGANAIAAPEPSELGLFLAGLLMLGGCLWSRRRQPSA